MFSKPVFYSICAIFALCSVFTAQAQVNVTTWHNDLARTGANTNETILTPANVGAQNNFGQIFSVPMDGAVFAEPLYLSGVNIAGGTHNVVFAATENDSVYAIDADNGTVYWQRSFLESGMTAVPSSLMNCDDIAPQLGITGTPVIDPSTGTLYVVSTSEPGPIQQLHAISVQTGMDMPDSPVTISASVPGTGSGASGGTLSFDPLTENQRTGLLLTNGHIVIAWGSHCDHVTYHGWIMSYNASTLEQEAVLNTTPNGDSGGIWMSGAAPSADANGNIFFGSSNGSFGGSTVTEFGDCIFKMPLPVAGKAWEPTDGFAPWNQQTMSQLNEDVGSSAALLLPDLPAGAKHQQLLVEASKNGEIFVVDRNHMGYYCASCSNGALDTNIVQELTSQLPNPMTGSPAYWNGSLYFGGPSTNLKAFSFNTTTGALSPQPVQTGAYMFAGRGPTISISADGNTNGIVWAIDSRPYGEVMLAYDATKLSSLLYQNTFSSTANRFIAPMIANGKVYAGTPNALVAFGLLSTKPVLTITASNVSVPYGQPIPALTGYTATGFVNGDNSSVLSGAPAETTTASQGSPAGTYPINITQGTLTAANYAFSFVNGTLTITGGTSTPPVSLQFAPNPIPSNTVASYSVSVGSGSAGQPNPVGTITLYGILPSGQLVQVDGPHPVGTAGTGGISTFSNTLPSGIPPGQYTTYATFQPVSGSTYAAANSPQVVLVSQ